MAKTNYSGDGNQLALAELVCSVDLTGGIHDQLIYLSVLNICLAITAFLGNILILAALKKESSLHPPSKLLYRSLATTDLCVAAILEPLIVINWMAVVNERWDICRYASVATHVISFILCSVSLLTSTAISVDRLLALLFGLRYRQVVTLRRTFQVIIVFWVTSSIVGTSMYFWNYLITVWYSYVGISLCLITSIFSYTKIFLRLRHRQAQIHQEQLGIPLNIARYRKAVSSALWVQLTLVVCYLPYNIVAAFMSQRGLSSSIYIARQFALTSVFLNSSLNPIVYCWRIREVRKAVKETIRQLHSCSSS